MTTPDAPRILGVDACRRGWVGIAIDGTRCAAYFGVTITDVVAAGEADGAFDVVAIDIPIGLPDSTSRQADDHASASHINRELTGSGISVQAFMLKPKLLEVEAWVLATAGTARRFLRGLARSLPSEPERFSDGIACAIWA